MNGQGEGARAQMFTLRVWVEDVGNGRTEIRGALKHLLTGETHHFREWSTLIRHLETTFTSEESHLESGFGAG